MRSAKVSSEVAYVVDASVAVKWFLPEEDAEKADALASKGDVLLAPGIVLSEVANALWKNCHLGKVDVAIAAAMLRDSPRYFSELIDPGELLDRAFAIATAHGHPVYDCLYLALAEQRSIPVVTADRRFHTKFSQTEFGGRVVALSTLSP
jgi:predicted nucleic acid-binding protein